MPDIINIPSVKWGGVCGICDKVLRPGESAQYDRETKTLFHVDCLKHEAPKELDVDFKEMVMAILQDQSNDLRDIKSKLKSIYEAQFPPVDKLMGGKHE